MFLVYVVGVGGGLLFEGKRRFSFKVTDNSAGH
jgi:hypothetical protein